jgi:hypothetical protein
MDSSKIPKNKEITPLVNFLTSMVSGGISGIISKTITAPIER